MRVKLSVYSYYCALLLAFAILLFDLSTKAYVQQLVADQGAIALTGFLRIVALHNLGMAFGLGAAASYFTVWLIVAIVCTILGAFCLYRSVRPHIAWTLFADALLFGGAFANIIDRIINGTVFDFIDLHIAGYHWPAFNVADMAIVSAVAIYIFKEK